MLQFSQYFNLKYIDFILIILSLISLVFFIQLIVNTIKNRNNTIRNRTLDEIEIETENTDNINPDLPIKNPSLINKTDKLSSIVDIIHRGFLYLFGFALLVQTINSLFPAILNYIFPSDSHQTIIITNNKKISQDLILLGRMSYSNDWIPIIPFNNSLQFVSLRGFKPTEKVNYNIRTGTKDIDHIIIANVTNKTYNKGIDAIVLPVPCNDVAIFTEPMSKLNIKVNVYLFGIINYFLLYFTAIVGSIALFLILFFKIDKEALIKIIVLSLLSLLLVSFWGYSAWLNLNTILHLV
jgi:hypothetical protein